MAADAIEQARALREEGNRLFKAGEVRQALAEYHKIYMYVHGYKARGGDPASALSSFPMPQNNASDATDEEMAQLNELKLVHFSNVGLCHLKLGNREKCVSYCTKALALDANSVKLLFRRGKSYMELGDLDHAQEDLELARKLDPSNREVVVALNALKPRLKEQDRMAAEKFAFGRMFGGGPSNGAGSSRAVDRGAAAPAAAPVVAAAAASGGGTDASAASAKDGIGE